MGFSGFTAEIKVFRGIPASLRTPGDGGGVGEKLPLRALSAGFGLDLGPFFLVYPSCDLTFSPIY